MFSSGFLESIGQNGIRGVKEQNFIRLFILPQFLQRPRQCPEHVLSAANICNYRHASKTLSRLLAKAVEGAQQLRRQIIHAVKANILQRMHSLRFSRSGKSGDN